MGELGVRGVLAVESPDPVLSYLSSLGLGLAAGTALIVDLEGGVQTERSLGDIAVDGPSLIELSPGRVGVALLSGRGVDPSQTVAHIEMLASHWPAILVRVRPAQWPGPTVPVRPLIPGLLSISRPDVAVWQPTFGRMRPPGDGPILPPLTRWLAQRLLKGEAVGRNRWVQAWRQIWRMPWA